MALEVRVYKEIDNYKEKWFGGMTLRQMLALGIAMTQTIGFGLLNYFYWNVSIDALSVVLVALCVPILCFGFLQPKGMTIEQYLLILYRYYTTKGQRPYATNFLPKEEIEHEKKKGKKERIVEYI
jgi:hypothetical protein